jgi:hypothetical protein
MSSAGPGASSVQDTVGGLALGNAVGPIATLEEQAAALKQRAIQATVVARDAAADAAQMTSAHTPTIAQHRKLFLRAAFGINPDGMAITNQSLLPEHLKAYKSVKTVEQYNYIIDILRNWGDDAILANIRPDDQDAAAVRNFCKKHHHGYNYVKQFKIEEAQSIDGSPKSILKRKKSGGVVLHMLDVFDVIHEAHSRQGHLKVDKTLANFTPHFYSPTYELCKLFIRFCFVCRESHPRVDAQKGAKKPILLSEFCDYFQVDLIDMRTMLKKDVYRQMQH